MKLAVLSIFALSTLNGVSANVGDLETFDFSLPQFTPQPPTEPGLWCCRFFSYQDLDTCDPCTETCGPKCATMDFWCNNDVTGDYTSCLNDPSACCLKTDLLNPANGNGACVFDASLNGDADFRYSFCTGPPEDPPTPAGPTGSGGGDPHFKPWSGTYYDFHGVCDLVFVQAQELDIQIRTKERFGYSFIESVAIKIGEQDVLEVGSYGVWFLNGVEGAYLPQKMDDQYLVTHTLVNKKRHEFTIELSKNETIVVSTFKDMVNIRIDNASVEHFGHSKGLMGSYPDGNLVGRDGTAIFSDHDAFGKEWQVLESESGLFQDKTRSPQHPQTCYMPSPPTKQGRRLGEGTAVEAAEKACEHWNEETKDMCIFDVLATGDLEVATTHGAF